MLFLVSILSHDSTGHCGLEVSGISVNLRLTILSSPSDLPPLLKWEIHHQSHMGSLSPPSGFHLLLNLLFSYLLA